MVQSTEEKTRQALQLTGLIQTLMTEPQTFMLCYELTLFTEFLWDIWYIWGLLIFLSNLTQNLTLTLKQIIQNYLKVKKTT